MSRAGLLSGIMRPQILGLYPEPHDPGNCDGFSSSGAEGSEFTKRQVPWLHSQHDGASYIRVCMYVCMYVCINIYIYIYIHTEHVYYE